MSSCSIKWCGKNSKTSNYNTDGITFHRFPKDPNIKDAWITATKRENWFPRAYSVICSRHFTSDCFEQMKGNRRRLFSSAIPTLLLPHLGSFAEQTPSDDEEPSTSAIIIQESTAENSPLQATDEIKGHSVKRNELVKSIDSTPKKVLSRTITDLSMKLKKSKLAVKRLQDSNRLLKTKVNTLKSLIEKLKDKELLTQENIDMNRLQNSNRQLRKKVIWLKRLLNEQKKKNLSLRRNVVWCPEADETMAIAKAE